MPPDREAMKKWSAVSTFASHLVGSSARSCETFADSGVGLLKSGTRLKNSFSAWQ